MRIHDNVIDNKLNKTEDVNGGLGSGIGSEGPLSGVMIYNNTITSPNVDLQWKIDQSIEMRLTRDNSMVCNNTVNQYMSFDRGEKGDGEHSVIVFGNRIIIDRKPPSAELQASPEGGSALRRTVLNPTTLLRKFLPATAYFSITTSSMPQVHSVC